MRPTRVDKAPGRDELKVMLSQLVDRLLEDESEEYKKLAIAMSFGSANAHLDDEWYELPEGYDELYDYPDEAAVALTGGSPGDDGEVEITVDLRKKTVLLEKSHEDLERMECDPLTEEVHLSDELRLRLREFVAENGEESLSMSWSGHGDEGNINDDLGTLPHDLLNELYAVLPCGWGNNEGSEGDYDFDLEEGIVTLSHTPNGYVKRVDEQYTWELGS